MARLYSNNASTTLASYLPATARATRIPLVEAAQFPEIVIGGYDQSVATPTPLSLGGANLVDLWEDGTSGLFSLTDAGTFYKTFLNSSNTLYAPYIQYINANGDSTLGFVNGNNEIVINPSFMSTESSGYYHAPSTPPVVAPSSIAWDGTNYIGSIGSALYSSPTGLDPWTRIASTNTFSVASKGLYHFPALASPYIALSTDASKVYFSADTITWTAATTATTATIYDITVVGTTLYMVTNGLGLWSSTDNGAVWTQVVTGTTFDTQSTYTASIESTGTGITALGRSTGNTAVGVTTTDLVTWSVSGLPPIPYLYGLTTVGANLLAFGGNANLTAPLAYYSTDSGVTWTASTLPAVVDSTFMGSMGNQGGTAQYLVGYSSEVLKSTDSGVTWVSDKTPITGLHSPSKGVILTGNKVLGRTFGAAFDYKFVPVFTTNTLVGSNTGNGKSVIWDASGGVWQANTYSYDYVGGIISNAPVGGFTDIIWSGAINLWIGVGAGAVIATSADLVSWTTVSAPVGITANLLSLGFDRGVLFAGGVATLLRSFDGGLTWENTTASTVMYSGYNIVGIHGDRSQNKILLILDVVGTPNTAHAVTEMGEDFITLGTDTSGNATVHVKGISPADTVIVYGGTLIKDIVIRNPKVHTSSITLEDPVTKDREVVQVDYHKNGVMLFTRGTEGTTALAWNAGVIMEQRGTKTSFSAFPSRSDASGTAVVLGDTDPLKSIARSAVALGFEASSHRNNTVTIGYSAYTGYERDIAIGAQSLAYNAAGSAPEGAIAIGYNSYGYYYAPVAIGSDSYAYSNAISMGNRARAEGAYSTALGYRSSCTSGNAVAIGSNSVSGGNSSVAVGRSTTATGYRSISILGGATSGSHAISIGGGALAGAYDVDVGNTFKSIGGALAIGSSVVNPIPDTTRLGGGIMVQQSKVTTSHVKEFSGAEVVLATEKLDLVALTPPVATIVIPTGAVFVPSSVIIMVADMTGVLTTQATVEISTSTDNITFTPLAAAALTTGLTAPRKVQDIAIPPTTDAVTYLRASVTVAGSATLLYTARVYFKGILVQE